mgnify:CR=1 FL=1
MKFLKKLMFFLIAFNPMYVILIVMSVIQIETSEEIEWSGFFLGFVIGLSILSLLTLLAAIVYVFKSSKKTTEEVEILSAKNVTGNFFLEYFSLFGLLALSFDISNPYMLIVLGLIIIMIGVVYISNNLYYINPLFNLLGYKFMNIKYKNLEGNIEREANIFTRKQLEKEIGSVIEVENSEFDFSKEVIKKKTCK